MPRQLLAIGAGCTVECRLCSDTTVAPGLGLIATTRPESCAEREELATLTRGSTLQTDYTCCSCAGRVHDWSNRGRPAVAARAPQSGSSFAISLVILFDCSDGCSFTELRR